MAHCMVVTDQMPDEGRRSLGRNCSRTVVAEVRVAAEVRARQRK